MPTLMPILQVESLSHERNERILFRDLQFSLNAGELLQIEGMNGSGKTTLLRILCGLLSPMQGKITWQGCDVIKHHAHYVNDLIYIGHSNAIKAELTVHENLLCDPSSKEVSIQDALTRVGLKDYQNTQVRYLSAGLQRRVAMAKLIYRKAKLWILDEPFTALDRNAKELFAELIKNHLVQQGIVILTTHQSISLQDITQKRLVLDS